MSSSKMEEPPTSMAYDDSMNPNLEGVPTSADLYEDEDEEEEDNESGGGTEDKPKTKETTIKIIQREKVVGFADDISGDEDVIPNMYAYSRVFTVNLIARKTQPKDIRVLEGMIDEDTSKLFASKDLGKLYEKSCFSIVLTEQSPVDRIIAHGSFKDSPQDPDINVDGKRWKSVKELAGINSINSLYLWIFVSNPAESAEPCFHELLSNTFLSCHTVDYVILEAPFPEFDFEQTPYGNSNLYPTEVLFMPKPKVEKKLLIYSKDLLFPKPVIRQGRQHDLDDLNPILNITVPQMEDTFGKSYLVDLIAMSDRNNQSIVAEVDGEAVGMIAVSTDINYSFLNDVFHLEPFHGLFKPHETDDIHCEPVTSRLFEPAKINELIVEDKFNRDANSPFFREEDDLEAEKRSKKLYRSTRTFDESDGNYSTSESSSVASGMDLMGGPELRNSKKQGLSGSGFTKSKVISGNQHPRTPTTSANASKQTSVENNIMNNKTVVDFYNKELNTSKSATEVEEETIGEMYGEDEYPKSRDITVAMMKSKLRATSRKLRAKLLDKTSTEQLALIAEVDEVFKFMEINGLNPESVKEVLDYKALKALIEAEETVRQVIYNYLHKTIMDESLLPLEDFNEPPPSKFYGLPNAITIRLVTMDPRYHVRLMELLHGAFLTFPNREYCIISAPLSSKELAWMKYFVRVMPKKHSLYPRSLFLTHKSVFTSTLRVRKARRTDLENVIQLIESLVDAKKILQNYDSAISYSTCDYNNNPLGLVCYIMEVTSHVKTPIVAMSILSMDKKAPYYQINYNLDRFTYFDFHEPNEHAYVHHFIMYPIFQTKTKIFMKEIMRLMKTDCFYHSIYPSFSLSKTNEYQSILNNFEEWYPLSPRRRIDYKLLSLDDAHDDERQPKKIFQNFSFPHAVIHYAKKFTFEPKIMVSTKIVFIGASDTTITCLDRLIHCSNFDFKHITLISTHGVPGGFPSDDIRDLFFPRKTHIGLSMKTHDEWHQRLGLPAFVEIVYGTAVKILRALKLIIVNDIKIVPYDMVIIATGRQFIRPDCPEPEILDEHMNKFKESTRSKEPKQSSEVLTRSLKRFTPKPGNCFMINTDLDATQALHFVRSFLPLMSERQIVIHGACIEGYCCAQALLALGVSPARIVFVTSTPPNEDMEWEKIQGYRDSPKIREVMFDTFNKLGINVLYEYNFRKWDVEDINGLINRVHFSSQNTEQNISVSCFAYFPFVVKRVGDEIASALTQAFIAFNRGVVISTHFETTDPNILAAGSCAVYQKRLFAEEYEQIRYNSYEVGQLLSESLIHKLRREGVEMKVIITEPSASILPPVFLHPILRYATLPGGWYYLNVIKPGELRCTGSICMEECGCEDCDCGMEIVTGSTDHRIDPMQKYFRLWLNSFQRVEGIECISKVKFPPSCIASIYGQHETVLNKLYLRLDKGEVTDLYKYFTQPRISAVCLDRWPSFQEELQELMAKYEIAPNVNIFNFVHDYLENLDNETTFKVDPNILRRVFDTSGLKKEVEIKLLEFLQYNRTALPMYAHPSFVKEDYKARYTSPFYYPLPKNF